MIFMILAIMAVIAAVVYAVAVSSQRAEKSEDERTIEHLSRLVEIRRSQGYPPQTHQVVRISFGLAQLYQLRGRVGRSPINAFAYCLYNRELGMSEDGKRRLEALQEFSQLGSGYSLAIRDLEIRGGGDIIGPRQKGIIDRIGLELYADILAQANDTMPWIPPSDGAAESEPIWFTA